jgi:hypothetical protein
LPGAWAALGLEGAAESLGAASDLCYIFGAGGGQWLEHQGAGEVADIHAIEG